MIQREAETTIDQVTEVLQDEWHAARAVPVHKRRAWFAAEEHADDVIFALRMAQGLTEDQEPVRVVSVPLRQRLPRGAPAAIIAQVAREATAHFGKEITARRVEACWKEYCAFEKESSEPEADEI